MKLTYKNPFKCKQCTLLFYARTPEGPVFCPNCHSPNWRKRGGKRYAGFREALKAESS